ncbi:MULTISPECIES: FCD domain-containing protein [unclassified Streptomyces]|uniref:FadR/GntR family transcriptional regulator n=1 Tax=unclassified Streptomyces TaxID=2593676 RepID=UPI000DB9B1DC|nr:MULTISPECIES: FCD domain-containing protein [unclassified Streptomyces]MYT73563.1 FCD domain-containing protein [Streptomyces sp. SID8367]RAJ85100.1 DNA-binding FadR family transcriptional regulator [Streptomyces sp. PsTaAH-137]
MKQIERVSLVESVSRALREEISSGNWTLGHRIPTEAELTERLGVSRASVREAVRGLVHAGLLATRQGDGTFVVATDPTDVAIRRRLTEASEGDVLEVRRGLDVIAANLAAQHRTDADVVALRSALAERARAGAARDIDAFVAADVEFHLGVARASHNDLLVELYLSFSRSLAESVRGDRRLHSFEADGAADHDTLAAAVEAGDATAAVSAALGLLDSTARQLPAQTGEME